MAALLLTALSHPALSTSAPHTVRLAQRNDLAKLAVLLHDSFRAQEPTFTSAASFAGDTKRELVRAMTIVRLALDMEQRLTPWDWCRHAQLVAENSNGQLLGFVEVWAEDALSLHNTSAVTPQPVLFNLCVAPDARRTGVARDLVRAVEGQCRRWDEELLFLKVRRDNQAALRLYEVEGFEHLGERAPQPLPDWQDRWKGGAGQLSLMRKTLHAVEAEAGASSQLPPPRPKSAADFIVSVDQVLQYSDFDAIVWYTLLLLRNQKPMKVDRWLPTAAALATYAGWIALWAAHT
jgi:ribosomal protein S18 acetylase RimI-like enzyme